MGNEQQLCAQLVADPVVGTSTWFDFLRCTTENATGIPCNVVDCADSVGLDASALEACVESVGSNLLYYSALSARAAKQSVSCTLTLDAQPWCVHDGTWKGCTEGSDGASLTRAVCKRYGGPTTPDVCSKALEADAQHSAVKHARLSKGSAEL